MSGGISFARGLTPGTGVTVVDGISQSQGISPPVGGDYLVHEVDGTSRFTLEDSSGFLTLEA